MPSANPLDVFADLEIPYIMLDPGTISSTNQKQVFLQYSNISFQPHVTLDSQLIPMNCPFPVMNLHLQS